MTTPLPHPLDPVAERILGALLEKSQATPDYYPLTLAALTAACNQKSGRDPVMSLAPEEVREGLETLRRDVLAWRSDGARSPRWSEGITRRLDLEPADRAVLTLLLLRGPQTPGELRARSERLHAFASLDEVHEALERLADRIEPVVAELPRQPGQKETRWAHLLGEALPETSPQAHAQPAARPEPATSPPGGLAARVESLERAVDELRDELDTLRRRLGDEGA